MADSTFQLHTAGGDQSFLPGVTIGGAVPGRSPGEIGQLTAEQYRKWFALAGDVGARVLRNYTIHPPAFYDELVAYNRAHATAPLYLVQACTWSTKTRSSPPAICGGPTCTTPSCANSPTPRPQ